MNLLVVEDDESLARSLTASFEAAGFHADRVGDGESALVTARLGAHDAIVLDVNLPDIDGFAVLRQLRAEAIGTPVIMLTARDTLPDRVAGLELGADDYVVKPFAPTELVARVRAVSRRTAGVAAQGTRIDGLWCDWSGGRATLHGRELDLRPREWSLLRVLATRAGRVVDRGMLIAELFDAEGEAMTNALEIQVSRLRAKLAPDGPLIRSVRGRGYRLG
ncbi:response regulator transcription factor [Brevundimonas sp.]|uniref:response regulator transcription factor n=1 Tax=Brevundimonas sp. TaxID=1871086 RepID=UPI0037BEBB44